MFGLGKILGSVVGGVLDKVGLGKIAPFVKMGLNAMTGNWMGVAKDVFGLVSGFKGNDFQNGAAKQPPLGGFGSSSSNGTNPLENILGGGKMPSIIDAFKSLLGMGGGGEGADKISGAFDLLSEIFDVSKLFNSRQSASQYSTMQA